MVWCFSPSLLMRSISWKESSACLSAQHFRTWLIDDLRFALHHITPATCAIVCQVDRGVKKLPASLPGRYRSDDSDYGWMCRGRQTCCILLTMGSELLITCWWFPLTSGSVWHQDLTCWPLCEPSRAVQGQIKGAYKLRVRYTSIRS